VSERRAGYVERLAEREVAILIRADHLDGLDALIERVPDVDVRGVIRVSADAGGWRRDLFLHAEENAPAVIAPRQRSPVAHDPIRGKTGGLGRIEHGRR
jgi:hypothetical protein